MSQPTAIGSMPRGERLLAALYEQQRLLAPGDGYLASHAHSAAVQGQADTFAWYEPYLPRRGRILDWGCRHAPDSCLIRERLGDVELHACDLCDPAPFRPFHDHAALHYRFLEHTIHLPYPDGMFDAVIGSGVLEHTAMDYESLKELYRILAFGGRLILTYLPNHLSVAEWYRRTIWKKDFHRRLYGRGEIARLLSRAGFYPLTIRQQSRLDCLPPRTVTWRLLRLAAWVVPLHRLSSTLCVVAQKVNAM
jgi:SAM-dependent methyltransferase